MYLQKNKNKTPVLIICFAVLLVSSFPAFSASGKSASSKDTISAVFTKIVGKVENLKAGETKWVKSKTGVFLFHGDKIRTDKKSMAMIVFYTGIQLKINELTEFTIEPGNMQRQGQEQIRLRRGQALFGVRAKADKSMGFSIRTPVAVVSIRGTQGAVKVGDDMETYVLVLEGHVGVENEYGEVQLQANQKTTVMSGNAPQQPEKASEDEIKKETGWEKEVTTNSKILKLLIKTEKGEEKTINLKFEK